MTDSKPWFRMYNKFATDPVMQSLAFEDQRHFVILLCLKCDGVLDRPIKGANRDRIIYRGLGLDPHAAEEAKSRLIEVGLIDKKWQPKSWNKLQFVSDVSTQRTRKSRKAKETGNGNETPEQRSGNAPEAEAEAYKDIPPCVPPKNGTKLPPDFTLTPERLDAFKAIAGNLDAVAEFEHFTDHHRAAGKPYKDWEACWRNWARNAVKFSRKPHAETQRNLSAPERVRAANARREAERNAAQGNRGVLAPHD